MEGLALDFGFYPDAARGRRVDARIRCGLADSLDAAGAALGEPLPALQSLAAAIRARPVRPGVMALYGDLLPAMMAQDAAALRDILDALAWPQWRAPAAFRVVTLEDAGLGPGMAAHYRNHLQDDPENLVALDAVDAGELREGRRRIDAALRLLARAALPLREEIGALINEIVLVGSRPAAGALAFHGASSFFLWGGLVLNLARHASGVQLVEGIVHEAGHCLLHGFTRGAALTTNGADARHASPLREDPRPIEGLVHAAYVLARMHFAMGALLQPALLEEGDHTAAAQAEARARQVAAAENFRSADATIAAHARFTPVGAQVFAEARAYMSGHGGPPDSGP